MKTVAVEVYLPYVKAHQAYQNAKASGSRLGTAIDRAVSEVLSRPGIKGKRITQGKITFAVLPEKKVEKTA